MGLRLAVDFDQNDWAALYATPADGANVFGTAAVDTSALRRQVAGTGGSAGAGTAWARYSDDRARYGKGRVSWTTGTSGTARIDLGYNGTTFDSGAASGEHTATIWARLASGSAADTFTLSIKRATGVIVGSSAAVALTTTWQKITATGSSVINNERYISLTRTTGTTALTVEIAGAMINPGAVVPDGLNCGAASLLEPLTDYWAGGRWSLGFVRPYQYVAPLGRAELELNNHDKRFSPEYSGGALFGDLLPNLLVQIGDTDHGIWWTGWTDGWKPLPGTGREKTAVLSATDARRFLDKKLPVLELYTLILPELLVDDILDKYDLPNTADGMPSTATAHDAWYAVSDGTHGPPLVELYADSVPYDHDGVKVLSDIMGGVQGHLWFDRTGHPALALQQGDDTPASYVDLAQNWLAADYTTGMIVNKCETIARKRKTQSGGSFTVWELDEQFTLTPAETETFRVFFKYDNSRKELVGAENLSTTITLAVGTTQVTMGLTDTGAMSTVITFTNTSGIDRTVTAATVVASVRVSQLREIAKEYEDSASVTANGTHSERLDFMYVQDRGWTKQLARYRVTRFKDARYEIPWVEMDVDTHRADCFDCHIGAAVHVEDDQTGHDDYYAVIGEQHTVRDGLTDHTVKLYLEPLYPTSVDDTSV